MLKFNLLRTSIVPVAYRNNLCLYGHELIPSNVYVRPNGTRRCKTCRQISRKEWDEKHPDSIKLMQQRYTNERKQRVLDWKLAHPCIDCGETDPVVLDLDHKDPLEKTFELSRYRKYSIDQIDAELEKCEARCANCHRRKHAKEKENEFLSTIAWG